MKKQAVLIIVHKNNYVLEKNLELIDSPFIDIFVHVDKKCKNFKSNYYKSKVKFSKIYFVHPRIDVRWSDYSQILVELNLIDFARKKGEYTYYHLISGQDLLIQPIEKMVEICNHSNKLFLEYRKVKANTRWSKLLYQRVSVNHVFTKYVRSKIKAIQLFARGLNKGWAEIQVLFNRDLVNKKHISLYYGSNWFSLPQDAIDFILQKRELINYWFSEGWLVDELFIPSIIAQNQELVNRLTDDNKRKISWIDSGRSGHPYVWRLQDYNQIMDSNKFFARKFDEIVDKKIIDKIYSNIRNLERM